MKSVIERIQRLPIAERERVKVTMRLLTKIAEMHSPMSLNLLWATKQLERAAFRYQTAYDIFTRAIDERHKLLLVAENAECKLRYHLDCTTKIPLKHTKRIKKASQQQQMLNIQKQTLNCILEGWYETVTESKNNLRIIENNFTEAYNQLQIVFLTVNDVGDNGGAVSSRSSNINNNSHSNINSLSIST